jgi:transcriptional regulator with XRE-family HTH domain
MSMINDKDKVIAKRIKEYRKQSGLTQLALGKKAGVSSTTIARVEGCVNPPSRETIEKLAEAFGITVSDILGR